MSTKLQKSTLWWTAGAVSLFSFFAFRMLAFQQPFREYPGIEYNDFALPLDFQEKTEWAFAG